MKRRLEAVIRQMEQVELQLGSNPATEDLGKLVEQWAIVAEEALEFIESTEGPAPAEETRSTIAAAVRDANAYAIPSREE